MTIPRSQKKSIHDSSSALLTIDGSISLPLSSNKNQTSTTIPNCTQQKRQQPNSNSNSNSNSNQSRDHAVKFLSVKGTAIATTGLSTSISLINSNNTYNNRENISKMNNSDSPKSATDKGNLLNNINYIDNNNNNNSISASIPLVRSRTAPSSFPQLHQTPQRERCNSGLQQQQKSPNNNNSGSDNMQQGGGNGKDINDWPWEMTSPSPQQKQQQPTQNNNNIATATTITTTTNVIDSDNQEQILFEQRLCEDIYGVAVRKINQNGKSNLRYVKCLYVDATEIRPNNVDDSNTTTTITAPTSTQQNQYSFSTTRSISSRDSRGFRGGFSRFLNGSVVGGGGGRDGGGTPSSNNAVCDNDANRSLLYGTAGNSNNNNSLYNGKVRVLSWGKKKDVTVPLDQFTAVRKGKVTDRSRRNTCPAYRIVSLITTEIHSSGEHGISNKNNNNNNNNSSNNNYPSLDIEAPTRLDRDKFARAFARFLNIPLLEEYDTNATTTTAYNKPKHTRSTSSSSFPQQKQYQQLNNNYHHQNQQLQGTDRSIRSNKSDMSPQSMKDSRHLSSSVANSIPDIALTTSNSHTTNASKTSRKQQQNAQAPLPVVTTKGVTGTSAHSNSKPPRNKRRSINIISGGNQLTPTSTTGATLLPSSSSSSPNHQSVNSKNNKSSLNVVDLEAQSDPPLISLPSSSIGAASNTQNTNASGVHQKDQEQQPNIISTKKGKMMLEIPITTKMSNTNPPTSNTPATSATAAHVHTHSTHGATTSTNNNGENDDDDDVGSVVSSITGAGFDQDLVEELHLALERMKNELEDSRAEASRAVKVAEQAIQSAENSNSKDWNNTVTHKAAEAAATAQKKSAEAMAKARVAEERLLIERKAAGVRKKQVEKAEQQAAHWQTRAAAAEVQRFAIAEALESERQKNSELLEAAAEVLGKVAAVNNDGNKKQQDAFDPFDTGDTLSSSNKPKSSTSTITHTTTISQMTVVEVDRLRSKLAMESARRRKLLDELQDLRGAIRVYCRPRAPSPSTITSKKDQPTIAMVSNEVLMLHRDRSSSHTTSLSYGNKSMNSDTPPLCFEFDGILSSDMSQNDVYAEFEAICASVVEGYKICIMTYGQANSGKTHTMLGEMHCNEQDHLFSIDNHGIHLRSMKQLFSLLEHRRDRFHDAVTMNLVEVHDERLIDLLAGTDFGEAHGRVEGSRKSSSSRRRQDANDDTTTSQPPLTTNSISSSRPKLEIKTNRDGETVLRGVLSVEVSSFEDVLCIWNESLAMRSSRVAELDIEPRAYELDSHVVATLKVSSKNLATGASASGRMQFVDFASSDITTKRSLGGSSFSKRLSASLSSSSSDQLLEDWKFTNKSLNTVRDVVQARTQYQRSVPYRNSTITHILSDSLEADTKVVMIACVSPDEKDIQNTACTLQFAQEMRKVIVGKATRHTTIGNNL